MSQPTQDQQNSGGDWIRCRAAVLASLVLSSRDESPQRQDEITRIIEQEFRDMYSWGRYDEEKGIE